MSHKWRRNKAWEDEHLTGALTPVRVVLRTFETIPLAIVLLVFIAIYATFASVPIGMLALIPTYLVYTLTLLIPLTIAFVLIVWSMRWIIPGSARAKRFVATFFTLVVVLLSITGLWSVYAWPAMNYSTTTGEGFRLFAAFCERYKSTTLRRLPGFEMTEMQFYAWWPMKLALILFVINMVITTLRRIEFTFKNLGVLSVHTGIVVIALGSIFYQRFKLEGDVLLPAASEGTRTGLAQRSFFSREEVVLFVATKTGIMGQPMFEQRLLKRLPRYNDYNLNATLPESVSGKDSDSLATLLDPSHTHDHHTGHDLLINVPHPADSSFDPDLKIDIVGYANYATMETDRFRADPDGVENPEPVRIVDMYAQIPGASIPQDRPVFRFPFVPTLPSERLFENQFIAIEHTKGMSDARWDILRTEIPNQSNTEVLNAIVVEIPGLGYERVSSITPGQRLTLGDTGWSIMIDQIAPTPPFPIITPGYEGATSSVAIMTIDPPGDDRSPFSRWVFHRFPELDQDLTPGEGGRPVRSAPDPSIRVSYLDCSRLQVYLDERADGSMRAIVRQPASASVQVIDDVPQTGLDDVVPNEDGARIDLRFAEHWEHSARAERPIPVPPLERDKSLIGSHNEAFVAVRASLEGTDWSETVWIPFAQYMGIDEQHTTITLPDGSPLMIGFGRAQRPFPGFSVALVDFEMIAYDHRGAPRDYQSLVRVEPAPSQFYPNPTHVETFEHIVKLNAPLRAPFHWDPDRSWVSNMSKRLLAGMNPNQFKLSQSGWDRAGWNQSQELVDQGVLDEPRVNFTILGVGNNPGIHIIALGSILISVGIPWAFYLKPWMVRRERDKLARAHKAKLAQESTHALDNEPSQRTPEMEPAT
jgi:hypothetical protein